MKSFIATTLAATFFASFLALAASAQAAQFVDDPLLQDFAASGQVINPHGIAGGR